MIPQFWRKLNASIMKTLKYFIQILSFFLLIVISGCEKEPPKVVPTMITAVSNITSNSATVSGEIIDNGGSVITSKGVCWNTTPEPTTNSFTINLGSGDGVVNTKITELQPGNTYYVRSFAINDVGTGYGNQVSISIPAITASITTAPAIIITSSGALSGGNITSDGGSVITARGVCWSTSANPTIENSKTTDATGIGSYVSSITELAPNTTYYLRAYATNSIGTSYGNEVVFTTLAELPVLTTNAITTMTSSSYLSGGSITSGGGLEITSRGVCWSTSPNPTITNSKTTNGTGTGAFVSRIANLALNTKYYVRAYATNGMGTAYGNEVEFTTLTELPVLTTTAISSMNSRAVTSGGSITSDGGLTITARGVCWSTNSNPTISNGKTSNGTGAGAFVSRITELEPNTTYYIRAYATNILGTSYGNIVSFILFMGVPGQNVTDIDGNVYHTVKIGSQEWLKENLKTTTFNDGTPIPQVTDNNTWNNLLTPAYCWYSNNKATYGNIFGGLYNWYAVNTNKLCPSMWKVPSIGDISALVDYLLGMDIAGAKLKEEGTTYFLSPNKGATNESGFSARPGGARRAGVFDSIYETGFWWTTSGQTTGAWFMSLGHQSSESYTHYWLEKSSGLAIRCIKE